MCVHEAIPNLQRPWGGGDFRAEKNHRFCVRLDGPARHTPARRPALNDKSGGGPCKTRGGRTPPAKRFIIGAQRVLRNIRNYCSGDDDDGPRGSWAVVRIRFEFFGARQKKKRGRRYVCTLFYK